MLALAALTGCQSDRVPIDSPSPGAVARERCQRFLEALPDTVNDQLRRPVDPDDALGAAWGDPAIELTCGGQMPADFDRFSACEVADDVGWYVPEEQFSDQGAGRRDDHGGRAARSSRCACPASYRPEGAAATMVDLAPAIKAELRQVKPCV